MSGAAPISGKALGAALVLPPLAWFAFQQGLGYLVLLACDHAGPPLGPSIGVAGLMACAICAGIAWRGVRACPQGTQALLAYLALGGAAAFGLAIALQTAATAMEAPCFR